MNELLPKLHKGACQVVFGHHHEQIADERKRRSLAKTQEPAIRALARACAERDVANPPAGFTVDRLNTLSNPQTLVDFKALIAADPEHEPLGWVQWEAGALAHEYEERRKELVRG